MHSTLYYLHDKAVSYYVGGIAVIVFSMSDETISVEV